jgi:hypothetical protein
MLAAILALALAAAEPPGDKPPATTVSPVTVSPQPSSQDKRPAADFKLNMDGQEQPVMIWPIFAYQSHQSGHVTLRCDIDIHGLAERCAVTYEHPAGHGFGHAALEMRPTFHLPPTLGPDGQPVPAKKNVYLFFAHKEDESGASLLPDMRRVIELDDPVWTGAASFDDLAAAYPAKGGGVDGYAVVRCAVARTGAMDACQVMKELPEGRDFGRAAYNLAKAKFRISREIASPFRRYPVIVDVAVRFQPPGRLDRTVMAPVWLAGVDPKATLQIFPPEAVAAGRTTGVGVTRCGVNADGTLAGCAPEPGEPDGLGFSEAAAKLASGMKMNLWGSDAAPVVGGVVHIPIRLNLKGG